MEILAIIPARSGSQGIKNKNIRLFAGKPLITHTIVAAKKSKLINRVIVSTDSTKIAKVAKQYKVEVPFLRPSKLAQTKSLIVDAVIHLLSKLDQDENYRPDYILLLQPTSPLRTTQDIDGALKLMFAAKADGVVSVEQTEQLLYTRGGNGFLKLVSNKIFLSSSNRQELPKTYRLDGSMIYAVKTSAFKRQKTFLPNKLVGYVVPRWRAVDLDEAEDFVVGEFVFNNASKLKNNIKEFK